MEVITQLRNYFLLKMILNIRKQPYYLSLRLPVTQNLIQNKTKIIKVSVWVLNY